MQWTDQIEIYRVQYDGEQTTLELGLEAVWAANKWLWGFRSAEEQTVGAHDLERKQESPICEGS